MIMYCDTFHKNQPDVYVHIILLRICNRKSESQSSLSSGSLWDPRQRGRRLVTEVTCHSIATKVSMAPWHARRTSHVSDVRALRDHIVLIRWEERVSALLLEECGRLLEPLRICDLNSHVWTYSGHYTQCTHNQSTIQLGLYPTSYIIVRHVPNEMLMIIIHLGIATHWSTFSMTMVGNSMHVAQQKGVKTDLDILYYRIWYTLTHTKTIQAIHIQSPDSFYCAHSRARVRARR